MTRRGSVIFYSCALVLGSFFLSVTYYVYLARGTSKEHWPRDFLFLFCITFLLTLVPLLLGAFLLRRLAARMHWTSAAAWTAAGTFLYLGVVLAFGFAGRAIETHPGALWWKTPVFFLFVGPWFALQQPLWLVLPPAALTSYFLFRVHHAFASQ